MHFTRLDESGISNAGKFDPWRGTDFFGDVKLYKRENVFDVMADSGSWQKIFADHKILENDFNERGFVLSAEMIKRSCQNFEKTSEKEVRILCKQDTREERPDIMRENDLFLLPVKNGEFVILKGEGYVDVPEIKSDPISHDSALDFDLETSRAGNSEMQHLDFAYASSVIRTFMNDESLVLAIRGRKYAPDFSFFVGRQKIEVGGVQTEVDAGYEGKDKLVLIEAKNSVTANTIIRQLFYPFRQWKRSTDKEIHLLFFEKREDEYLIWQYEFKNPEDYNSINLIKSARYRIIDENERRNGK